MKRFTALYETLDSTTSTNKKIDAMVAYFKEAPSDDAAWALYFLSGRRLKRLLKRAALKSWLETATGLELWMIEESYHYVGDFAETVSLLMQARDGRAQENDGRSLTDWVEKHILPLTKLAEADQGVQVQSWWLSLPKAECFVLTKLLTGAMRVGVSQLLIARAIAKMTGIDRAVILHRLMGDWSPTADFFVNICNPDTAQDDISRPYPFYLASPLEQNVTDLGPVDNWQAEWKWDGIRAQLIQRSGQVFIWSRGEELVTERFPEIKLAANELPEGTVLDGEIVAWQDQKVMPFHALQKRLGRKSVSKKLLQDLPVIFLAYDILEESGQDIRTQTMAQRRSALELVIDQMKTPTIQYSGILQASDWDALSAQRAHSRELGVEGLMLKRLDSPYEVGRKRGAWWKWKIDPLTIDAVMIYAQAGSGRRATLFTDYTFAVWENEQLVPVAKAYSGLDDQEITRLDKWIRKNTLERFGPVRSVKPEHVFEIGFEGINPSSRHKSGIALRFPRILRWRTDLPAKEANSLDMVKSLLQAPA